MLTFIVKLSPLLSMDGTEVACKVVLHGAQEARLLLAFSTLLLKKSSILPSIEKSRYMQQAIQKKSQLISFKLFELLELHSGFLLAAMTWNLPSTHKDTGMTFVSCGG